MSRTDIERVGDGGGEWAEYRRLVLRELGRLDKAIGASLADADKLKADIGIVRERIDGVRKAIEKLANTGEGLESRITTIEHQITSQQARTAGAGAIAGTAGGGILMVIWEVVQRLLLT